MMEEEEERCMWKQEDKTQKALHGSRVLLNHITYSPDVFSRCAAERQAAAKGLNVVVTAVQASAGYQLCS